MLGLARENKNSNQFFDPHSVRFFLLHTCKDELDEQKDDHDSTSNFDTILNIVSFFLSSWHLFSILGTFEKDLDEKEDDLDSTENGESSEETHRATNHAEGRLKSNLEIYISKSLNTIQECFSSY